MDNKEDFKYNFNFIPFAAIYVKIPNLDLWYWIRNTSFALPDNEIYVQG
jgi:hypothetical protein